MILNNHKVNHDYDFVGYYLTSRAMLKWKTNGRSTSQTNAWIGEMET